MPGSVHVPFYATGFRGDALEEAIGEVSRYSLRYGASEYSVHRADDDRYKMLAIYHFDSKTDWTRFWMGPEFVRFRTIHQGWFQVPLLYAWHEVNHHGTMVAEPAEGNAAA